MHRLILTSAAYRQSSRLDPLSPAHARAKQVDPEARLLWRQRMRRLEAEALRDAMLAASGTLSTRMLGPPVPFVVRPDGEVIAPEDSSGHRRSIYLKVRRSQPLTLLQSFDQPVMETNCTRARRFDHRLPGAEPLEWRHPDIARRVVRTARPERGSFRPDRTSRPGRSGPHAIGRRAVRARELPHGPIKAPRPHSRS